MLRKISLTLALGLSAMLAGEAQAGLLSSALTYDGTADTLIDNSVAWVAADGGVAGSLDVGDVVAGFVRIEQSIPSGDISPDLGELIVVFSAQIISRLDTGANTVRYQLGATTLGPTLNTLLPAHALANGPFAANAIAAVISAPASTSPVNPATQSIPTALANVNDLTKWSLDAVLGFAPVLNAFGFADFFEAEFGIDLDDDGFIELTELAMISEGGTVGAEKAGFTVLSNPGLGGGTTFLPVPVQHLGLPLVTTSHDIVISSAQLFAPDASQVLNGYQFGDQATFRVNPVPEPTSMVLLALGAVSACGVGLRRRRQAA